MDTNISPTVQKMLVGAVLFAAWSYLVFTGRVPATDYVENLKIGLTALGLYHVSTAPARAAEKAAKAAADAAPVVLPTQVK
ncbi:hypothetical protein [Paraburkholderia sp. J11-2]|uniref:hypothetical protein n=1 Tax=Paraburkholderia sp. J11-2 TaxID=2805431 RepID=UPI002AB748FF|nr:hypothetical protein [Paraburkholderia sp. J11-2]